MWGLAQAVEPKKQKREIHAVGWANGDDRGQQTNARMRQERTGEKQGHGCAVEVNRCLL